MMQNMGRYQIQRELGRGAMAVVYLAFDPELNRNIALKVLHAERCANADVRRRFLREAKAAGRLGHGNIVTVYDVGEERDRPYIAMELLDGRFLDALLRDGEVLSWQQVREIAMQLADALDLAQRNGVIHRDIKPANIVWLPREQKVKITDFGIAHVDDVTQSEATQVGQIVGTPQYMSPEQITGRPVDARSDLFSLGVVLYQLLARQRPFSGDTVAALTYQIAHQKPRPLGELVKDVPATLTDIVDRLLAKDPAARFQSAQELLHALKPVREGHVPPATTPLNWRRIIPALMVVPALVVLVVVLLRSPSPVDPVPVLTSKPVTQNTQPSALNAVLADFSCAHLEVVAGENNAVTIRGHVRQEDLSVLMDAVDKIGGLNNVTYEVEALPWPFCEAAAMIARAAPLHFEIPGQLHAGDAVLVEVDALSEPSYRYVDLYRDDGSVVHVYPESAQNNPRVAPGIAGVSGKSPNAWRVQAPYGDAMVVVLATQEPLSVATARTEPAQDYLTKLHRILNTGKPLLGAQYRMVTTEPKP